MGISMHGCAIVRIKMGIRIKNKYFELKNSWGARAPLNLKLLASNFPMYVQ